ncbi:mucin-3B [Cynoglossus semilaevis]|uniref:mucin-3B n=1 Tax=Cynoglossus semilaevis TaxID=244447 RepID=UPI0004957878|nr:mucin-3B-like [Cynoglossus semilaevis]
MSSTTTLPTSTSAVTTRSTLPTTSKTTMSQTTSPSTQTSSPTSKTSVPTSTVFTSTLTPTTTGTIASTTPVCTPEDCRCAAGTCVYSPKHKGCRCKCHDDIFGNTCIFGVNDTVPAVDMGKIPQRRANLTLKVDMLYSPQYEDLNSTLSVKFITTLEPLLTSLCKEADRENFLKVKVVRLSEGSIVADSAAVYSYPNNDSEIQFINNQLDTVLTTILTNTTNLETISQAFNTSNVTVDAITFEPPKISNISDLQAFINCSEYANYTAEVIDGQWRCSGPCRINPEYCNRHGECFNHIYNGPICSCFKNSLEEYYGPTCEHYRKRPGFYGAVFGSITAAILIVILVITAVFVTKKYRGIWIRTDSLNKNLDTFEEDFFDFSYTGLEDTERPETLSPHLESVNTTTGESKTS